MGQRVAETGVLTTINLTIIAIAAVLTILAILYGAAQKRKRAEAERIERARIEEDGGPVPTPSEVALPLAEPEPVAAPAAPPPPEPVVAPPAPEPEPVAPEPTPLADEPIAAAAPLDASPATQVEPPAPAEPAPPAAPAQSYTDAPVAILKGLGPKVATRLAELGVTTVGQLAALDTRAAQDLDAHLGPFTGRMTRDRWLEQAKLLAAGDKAGFEAAFGRL